MKSAEKPQALETLEIRVVGDESIVHDPTNDKLHVLNSTAAKILKLCDGSRTQVDIVNTLCAEMGADTQQVAQDVDRIVGQFSELGLIR